MKLRDTVDLPLKALTLRGGWEKSIDEAHVRRLADEIEAGAILPPIRVDEKKRIIFGYHRVAAHRLAGRKEISAEIVELESDDEAEAAALGENLHRRNLTADQRAKCTARLVEIYASRMRGGELSARPAGNSARQPGRPKTVEAKAREAVAEELDTTPEAVRHMERRAKADEPQPPTPEALPIDPHGAELPDDIRDVAVQVQGHIDAAANAMNRVVAALGQLGAMDSPVLLNTGSQALSLGARELAREIRSRRPAHLCPYCCGGDARLVCAGCRGCGWVSEEAYQRAPKDKEAKPASKSMARRLRVQDAEGKSLLPDEPKAGG